jgi:hypothetical protein
MSQRVLGLQSRAPLYQVVQHTFNILFADDFADFPLLVDIVHLLWSSEKLIRTWQAKFWKCRLSFSQ